MEKIKFQNKSEFRLHNREKLAKLHNAYPRDKMLGKQILERLKKIKIHII